MNKILFNDLGLIDYKECWDLQEKLLNANIQRKSTINRKSGDGNRQPETLNHKLQTENHLLFCEHPHVYTLGKSGSEKNILFNAERLKEINATYVKTNRGGDITYHGPGQIVGYPVLDLELFFTDIVRYMRSLEEVIIRALGDFKISASRLNGSTGVWLEPDHPAKTRKICAMGVRTSRWVTMHGFALNVNTDLRYFDYIIPCGIAGKAVTSMEKELGKKMSLDIVQERIKFYFAQVFECEFLEDSENILYHEKH
ncbi:MAG: lipoyl(octanoyl) transferase LipB [Bacteroidetes bacterium]|nr:lipoyl(octanoyl) transferase LipB [Bacteroidota bacterium]